MPSTVPAHPAGPTTLYRGGRIHTPCHPAATALLVAGDTVGWIGGDTDAPAADRTVDLAGALVTPAFVDAHVHLTATGLSAATVDLSGARSAADLLARVAAAARTLPPAAVVLGHGWDESGWADPTPPAATALARAAGDRPVYAAQASLHSALCSPPLLAAAVDRPGYDPSGWVRREAHQAARAAALAAVTPQQRAHARRAALTAAAAAGVAAVHECGGPEVSSPDDFRALLALSGDRLPEVYGYWGELTGAARARALGAVGAGGDLFADGALGAHTAHLRDPYHDRPDRGTGYLTPAQVRDHLLDCHRHRVAGGFHAIGDAALATVLAGFAEAARRLGVAELRAGRHRLEHAELLDRAMIARLVEYGVTASVQPAFDRLWGGSRQLYARRLGPERALSTNPLGSLHTVGVPLAFGSDSPVTPVDPWGTVRAAVAHHNPRHRLPVATAFAAHTRGGWRPVGDDRHGVLAPGAPATFAVWHAPAGLAGSLPVLLAGDPARPDRADPVPLPVCHRTVLRGSVIFDDGVLAPPAPGAPGTVGAPDHPREAADR